MSQCSTANTAPVLPQKQHTESESYWDSFKEWLLPSGTFEKSATPKSDLAYARWSLVIFYAMLLGLFIYTVTRMCYSGRIELFSSMYKVDFVEAPSLAFCPFNPNAAIQWPRATDLPVLASKVDLDGTHALHPKVNNCTFDRTCACVDMGAFRLSDLSRRHGNPASTLHHEMVFRESMEILTTLTDPSPEQIIKVGIYDTYDTAPDWFYVNQGAMFIGQLELIVWTVVDISFTGLWNTVKGDIRAMVKNRHIFRYTSQQVSRRERQPPTRLATTLASPTSVRYEMKTFFVEETMSSHRAFSLYTVGVIIALIMLRWVVVDIFLMLVMPEWTEHRETRIVRELSPTATWLRNLCCCCLPSEPDEHEPLLDEKRKVGSP